MAQSVGHAANEEKRKGVLMRKNFYLLSA